MWWALAKCRVVCGRFGTRLRVLLTEPRGQAGVITAILAPVIIGAAALAIDAALWQVNQRSLQGAADQAAIAGINAYVASGDNGAVATDATAQAAALAVAASFGYPACTQTPTNGCPCTSGYGSCAGLPLNPTSTTCQNDPTNCLQVIITQPQQRFLSQVVYSGNPVAEARAATTLGAGGSCVLALDQAPNPLVNPPSVSLGGSSTMDLSACNLVNNLNDPNATANDTDVTGSSVLQATNGGQILLAQTNTFFGQGQVSPTPIYGSSPAPDPYASRTPPSTSGGCTYPNATYDTTATISSSSPPLGTSMTVSGTTYPVHFTPASPTTPVVICGGLNITTGSVYLDPGIYIMDGGGLTATGNAAIYGTGVTIYVTCDSYYTNLTTNPFNNKKISPAPDCTKNYGTISIAGTSGSCTGHSGDTCDANGYCNSPSSPKCISSSDCGGNTKYCSHPDGTFYGDVGNTTAINNLVQFPVTLIGVSNPAISGLGIPNSTPGATTFSTVNSTPTSLTLSTAATNSPTNVGEALLGPGYCSKACTGSGTSPKVTLTPPVATTDPPTGSAGISMWIDKGAPVGQSATFTGDANLNISGAIYAPTQAVTYEGGQTSSSNTQCNQLVSLTVNMSGGHTTTFSQTGCAANSGVAGHGTAQLVE